MTTEEKAEELVVKYLGIVSAVHPLENYEPAAKQCALIAVDEVIELLQSYDVKGEALNWDAIDEYWYEVKQEIENR